MNGNKLSVSLPDKSVQDKDGEVEESLRFIHFLQSDVGNKETAVLAIIIRRILLNILFKKKAKKAKL